MLWISVLGAILIWAPSPTITHRNNAERGHTQIKPKPCSVNGIEGTCMFVYECIKTEGRHVGMCVDNFMFGSCCSHNATQNAVLPHHSHHASHHSHQNFLHTQTNVNSSPRPSSFSINARPYSSQTSSSANSKVRPSKPVSFVTRTTKRPPTTTTISHRLKEATSTTRRPATMGKPWTNKPPHFVTAATQNSSLSGNSLVTATALPQRPTSVYDLIAISKPTPQNQNEQNVTLTTKTSFYVVNDTSTSGTEEAGTSAMATWATQKPHRPGSPSANEIEASSKPHSSKPQYWSSGKPSYVSRPWQGSTEPIFVTRPRPSSHVHRPKPTRKPVALITAPNPSRKSTTTSTTTTTTTTSTTTTTTTTTTSSTTTTTTTTETPASTEKTTEGGSTAATAFSSTTLIPGASKYQYSGQCGVAALSPRPEMRIVGGKNAPFGGWPWQVSVRRTSFFGFSSTHRCGGAVINENWIATAGHCVDDLLTSQIRIRVGEYDFSSVMEPYPFVERAVSKKVVHPKYNFFTYEYDLALVRLDSPLEFQPHISPICLPASDDLLIGENATVTGWGRLSEGGTLPSVLQQVSVPIVSNDKCKSMFLRAGRHEFIPEIFLCAGYENGGQDSCQGDSGGPLQVKGKNGRYFLAGIISWGIGCAEANLPGVCTRISKFVPWILENVT